MSKPIIGAQAPAFEGLNQHNEKVTLSQFLGQKVILYFYPKDSTPGCTTEACNFRDHYESLLAKGFVVIGVSGDDVKSHQKFAQKYELPFHLIADAEKHINTLYGVWVEKSMYGKTYMGTARTTFLIDEKGVIQHIIEKVDNKNATQQVLDLFQ